MPTKFQISFGDNVRVLPTSLTESLGLANLVGQGYGLTTPSITGVEVVGDLKEDFAFNVFFEERRESRWFVPGLLELVDHAPGAEITLDGVPKRWTRNGAGEWIESNRNEEDFRAKSKPRWKF